MINSFYRERTFHEAACTCGIGESIYQTSNPDVLYAKNHDKSFYNRVPKFRQDMEDWRIYDSKEQSPLDRRRKPNG